MDAKEGDMEAKFASGVPGYASATVVFHDPNGRIIGYGQVTRAESGSVEVVTFSAPLGVLALSQAPARKGD